MTYFHLVPLTQWLKLLGQNWCLCCFNIFFEKEPYNPNNMVQECYKLFSRYWFMPCNEIMFFFYSVKHWTMDVGRHHSIRHWPSLQRVSATSRLFWESTRNSKPELQNNQLTCKPATLFTCFNVMSTHDREKLTWLGLCESPFGIKSIYINPCLVDPKTYSLSRYNTHVLKKELEMYLAMAIAILWRLRKNNSFWSGQWPLLKANMCCHLKANWS